MSSTLSLHRVVLFVLIVLQLLGAPAVLGCCSWPQQQAPCRCAPQLQLRRSLRSCVSAFAYCPSLDGFLVSLGCLQHRAILLPASIQPLHWHKCSYARMRFGPGRPMLQEPVAIDKNRSIRLNQSVTLCTYMVVVSRCGTCWTAATSPPSPSAPAAQPSPALPSATARQSTSPTAASQPTAAAMGLVLRAAAVLVQQQGVLLLGLRAIITTTMEGASSRARACRCEQQYRPRRTFLSRAF